MAELTARPLGATLTAPRPTTAVPIPTPTASPSGAMLSAVSAGRREIAAITPWSLAAAVQANA